MTWFKDALAKVGTGIAGAPPLKSHLCHRFLHQIFLGPVSRWSQMSVTLKTYLESLRLDRARVFMTRFHGVVYSFVQLPREGEARAQLAAVSRPEKLAELDKSAIDRVITVSKQMMGATAFRGGPISLEIGLFTVKSGNLLTPLLEYVARVSSTAGISYIGAIKPFVPLIVEGMDLIAGQKDDTALQVGVDSDFALTKSGAAAIIALPKGAIDVKKLSLTKTESYC